LEYRGFLWMLLTLGILKESFVMKKLIKIIADISKHEYPHFWPSFLEDTFKLSRVAPHSALEMTKTIVEEYFSTRNDVSSMQYTLLQKSLIANLQGIVHGIVLYHLDNGYHVILTRSNLQNSLQFNEFQKNNPYPSPTENHPQTLQECQTNTKLAFEILQNLIACLDNHDIFWTSSCMETLIKYILMDENDDEFTINVLNCFNELLTRPTVPFGASLFVFTIQNQLTRIFLHHLYLSQNENFDRMPDEYTTRIINVVENILLNHLDTFTDCSIGPFHDFLQGFADFTFSLVQFY
jgi:hypothetical protein